MDRFCAGHPPIPCRCCQDEQTSSPAIGGSVATSASEKARVLPRVSERRHASGLWAEHMRRRTGNQCRSPCPAEAGRRNLESRGDGLLRNDPGIRATSCVTHECPSRLIRSKAHVATGFQTRCPGEVARSALSDASQRLAGRRDLF